MYKLVRESLNFERTGAPLDKIGIGRKALLKAKADEMEWDWENDGSYQEEFVDLIPYPIEGMEHLYLKVLKLTDRDGRTGFTAINNIGEPYNFDPFIYPSAEEAIKEEKEFLDNYDND